MARGLKSVSIGLSVAACFAFGFFWRDVRAIQAPSSQSVKRLAGVRVTGPNASGEQIFRSNYQRILANAYQAVKVDDLKFAGVGGMMASLGDPHTVFLPPRAAQAFSDDTRANFFGVGARLGPDPLGAKVATVFEDGPAFAAGLREGNIITGVNGKSVGGTELEQIIDQIKGKEGTTVRLTVIQPGTKKSVELLVRRARITVPTVSHKVLKESKLGYLRVDQFSEPTTVQFDRALNRLEADGIRGLVIDLRSNPGGLLETAKDMLSRFVENKMVVKMKLRNGPDQEERTDSGQIHEFRYPIVVLIDENSASAAEIFAGCLHDYGKATLVGVRSYGKASVQQVFPLVDNSSAKITVAKYYLPASAFIGRKVDEDGVMISGGLEPDLKAELETTKEVRIGEPEADSQLRKAIEVLKSKTAG